MTQVAAENLEAREAWDGVLFDRFLAYRHLVVEGLALHGDEAMRNHPPRRADRVLDVGCGFGDASRALAELIGPGGSVLGVDVAPRFVHAAREESRSTGVSNVRFEVADVEVTEFEERFDYAFARFGTIVLRQPGPGASKRAPRARARRPLRVRGLAPQT